ncbi:lecithin retinol acyltransferase family protein [Pseudomonas chlororaphis]|uniref:lecithin retinol acyltransferase family protein n=1 Tax=Pseudomonas chlororaphis TaxID=587753 RepID=UPI000B430EF5|nr:lecithin retinol acyltransferase family protein [Pseudomonas chlororaphis]AZE04458.1 hypothetical protein C4K11_2296 [Pseudomonas chlororaphis subsp. aureofaciens]MBP5065346.1 lecithin retinol acyltransferase family protein [Pseudomonas chlororaphis]QTT94006.1 lecithin retinol acyltransferase family protein [Pseudomonas chlororaphis]
MYPTGTHLIVGRGLYTHHGIFVGRNRVVHYSGMGSGLHKGCIESTTLEAFLQGKNARIKTYKKVYFRGPEICRRARSRLGEDEYNLVFNNCEHFANWCVTNQHTSEQVEAATQRMSTAAVTSLLMRKATKEAAEQTTKTLLTKGGAAAASRMMTEQATKAAASQIARSLTSQVVAKGAISTASGLAAAGGASSLTTVGISAAGFAGGAALAPAVATVAVAVGAAYVVGSIWDWLTD